MYRTMENKNYNNTEDALKELREGKIKAFIWDSARLEYEAGKSCDFVTAGELFGRSSYGDYLNFLNVSEIILSSYNF